MTTPLREYLDKPETDLSGRYILRVTEGQRDALVAALSALAKVILVVAGIRGGKTHVGALATVLRAIHYPTDHDQCHAVVSPTFPMSKIGPEAKLWKVLEDKKLFPVSPLAYHAKSERAFYVRNAAGGLSKIRIFSGEKPHRWRGDSWRSGWLDEAARLSAEAWEVAQGRLAELDAPAIFTTTPDGMNFVYDLSQQATKPLPRDGYRVRVSPDRSVVFITWSSMYNAFLQVKTGFERLRRSYDADTFAQEVEAAFVAQSGRVYKPFDRERHVRPFRLIPTRPVFVGQDFNVDRMFTTFSQEIILSEATDGPRGLHFFDEMERKDADTHSLIPALRRWCYENDFPWDRLIVTPDATGKRRQTVASKTAKSDIAILRAAKLSVRAPKVNPRVKDRVNAVNGLFYNDRLFVDPKCELLIEAFERQLRDDKGEPEKDGVLDNRVDAAGYSVWYKFPLRGPRATLGLDERTRERLYGSPGGNT